MYSSEGKINAVEMQSLSSMYGVSRKDRYRNSDVRDQSGLTEGVVSRIERGAPNARCEGNDLATRYFRGSNDGRETMSKQEGGPSIRGP
ncbi:hypothetical protein EVAR_100017_1 [Eumeta japonica]|uniref:Uncharacterized protein n=1 Tax=Eumeta variegata TaxID=151549 RepID=A0A4C1ZS40_EUMVA|nr:hypothetical protein EVAR_100017_1 [Eumeta japonica]